ncbi:hypothetical protein KEM55_005741 [Ascosphaera atra]|nr:hypothetical protein KEM55_005741 [Ascosphaera atra]
MHSSFNRLQSVFGFFTTLGLVLGILTALSTTFFPADVKSTVALKDVKVLKGRPNYYAPRREEYAQVRFDLDADLSSLFNWNTKQVFLYVLVSYPSTLQNSSIPVESMIWDHIIPAKESPYSLSALKQKYLPDKSSASRNSRRPNKKQQQPKRNANKGKKTKEDKKHGVLHLKNQRPKYHITDISHTLANRPDAQLIVGWNVQPWIGPLMWSTGSRIAKNVGELRVHNLGFVTAGDEGGKSEVFVFPEVPVKKREMAFKIS